MVVVDYDRQHAVTVHCLDGLLRQLVEEDIASGVKHRCPNYVEVRRQTQQPHSNASGRIAGSSGCDGTSLSSVPLQPESEITIEEFDRRCKRPPPPPVRTVSRD